MVLKITFVFFLGEKKIWLVIADENTILYSPSSTEKSFE